MALLKNADVAIAGASFAGLGLAYYLKDAGLDVVLIDGKGIGERRTSACGMPTRLAQELAPSSILHSVKRFYFETPSLRRTVELEEEYCALDYKAFCTGLFRRSGATLIAADVSGASGGVVRTSKGDVAARFIADCTGWKRVLSRSGPVRDLITAVEMTAPVGGKYADSLCFFIDKKMVPGYGWIFPVGNGMARVGAGGAVSGERLNHGFRAFLDKVGIPFSKNELTGGAIPCTGLGAPVEDGIFFVGDSAKEVLPLSAEGIRTSLYFARQCALAISAVDGKMMTDAEGREFYAKKVLETRRAFRALKLLQKLMVRMPQPLVDAGLYALTSRALQKRLMRAYSSIAKL